MRYNFFSFVVILRVGVCFDNFSTFITSMFSLSTGNTWSSISQQPTPPMHSPCLILTSNLQTSNEPSLFQGLSIQIKVTRRAHSMSSMQNNLNERFESEKTFGSLMSPLLICLFRFVSFIFLLLSICIDLLQSEHSTWL